MTIPLLTYEPSSQNQRVQDFFIGSEESPKQFSVASAFAKTDFDTLIQAAYRQIFNEQQMLEQNRLKVQESKLKSGFITVQDFIRALLLSESFRQRNYDVNNNYRFVQMCVQRVLGRDIYGQKEVLSWSILLATQGLNGFVDALLNSEEYLDNFGLDTVPYQRRRILPQRTEGNLPFARMPRYGADYRQQLEDLGYFQEQDETPWVAPAWVSVIGRTVTIAGAGTLILGAIAVALAAFEIIKL
ncbi:phycobilisome rod-core linker polypeptide CpcG [Picosynechococcus sp. PCC 7003]|uniref:phycobilisome rod-core linker polypeptide n=1 Tax=Picosynechococcus sp. PCC 7003 TaxID=374981 RepID=UPI000810D51B|nr:phycobilisome rod-core linker polypeptide [Picosynechococcus sp. PCC 7003]ANV83657.1 phycobilisome rod-core linker polypeptide CpcG [Picosynechococcus sp. PCC 7003]